MSDDQKYLQNGVVVVDVANTEWSRVGSTTAMLSNPDLPEFAIANKIEITHEPVIKVVYVNCGSAVIADFATDDLSGFTGMSSFHEEVDQSIRGTLPINYVARARMGRRPISVEFLLTDISEAIKKELLTSKRYIRIDDNIDKIRESFENYMTDKYGYAYYEDEESIKKTVIETTVPLFSEIGLQLCSISKKLNKLEEINSKQDKILELLEGNKDNKETKKSNPKPSS